MPLAPYDYLADYTGPRKPPELASYRPDPETQKRLLEYLKRLKQAGTAGPIDEGAPGSSAEAMMSPSQLQPGLGSLREYDETRGQSGYARP